MIFGKVSWNICFSQSQAEAIYFGSIHISTAHKCDVIYRSHTSPTNGCPAKPKGLRQSNLDRSSAMEVFLGSKAPRILWLSSTGLQVWAVLHWAPGYWGVWAVLN